MKTLSLCMIIKDGEKYIEECLESISPCLSEIIIVDTGSTDSTLEKVKRFNPQIYHHEWNNNFADARNESLRHATGDYTIVLDADEVIFTEDIPKLIDTINNTSADCISVRFYNLIDENNLDICNVHEGLRIFKTGAFHFSGAIHEQPIYKGPSKNPIAEYAGIRVKHYGYIKSNVGEKKFNRNMTILKDVLEKNPNEAFHLFNIGNQYMSIGDYETALSYYQKAYENKDVNLAYSPHLFFRYASCLKNLRHADECLTIIAEGLKLYPACTDLEFLRGLTLTSLKRFTLAIDSFNKCLEMGPAPSNLCFFTDTGSIRPFIEIADIYNVLEDYEKSLNYYLKALQADVKRYYLIYKVAGVLNKIHADKNLVTQNLRNLFADSKYKANVMVTTDALIDEKLYEQAKIVFHDYMEEKAPDSDILFLSGCILFYQKEYFAAFTKFSKVPFCEQKGVLPNVEERSYQFMAACSLLYDKCRTQTIDILTKLEDSTMKDAYWAILKEEKKELHQEAMITIGSVLSKLLEVYEYDTFQNSLPVLNLIDSKDVLINLAEIYYRNNFHDMAVETIIRSIKELDSLNTAAVMILNKEFTL